jgi:hypothetical protein
MNTPIFIQSISIMMTNPTTSHGPSTDDVYLIADTTRPIRPAEPCVRVPPQYEAAYQEILDEYHRRKDKPVKLERALNIAKQYELLDADDFGFGARSNAVKSRDLFWLGDVSRESDLAAYLVGHGRQYQSEHLWI